VRRGGLRWRGASGAQELEAARRARQRGRRPFYSRCAHLSVTDGPTAASRGARVWTNGGPTGGPWWDARPASVGTPRGVRELQGAALGHAAPWEGAQPWSARGSDAEGGGRPRRGTHGRPAQRRHDATWSRRDCFILGHFEHVFLPILE
jgi:hypothetical protein